MDRVRHSSRGRHVGRKRGSGAGRVMTDIREEECLGCLECHDGPRRSSCRVLKHLKGGRFLAS